MAKTLDEFKARHDPETIIARLQNELKAATQQSADAIAIRELLQTAALRLDEYDPPAWTLKEPKKSDTQPGVPTLFLSDLHWGEVVRATEIARVNSFNLAVAQERLRYTVETAIHLCRLLSPKLEYPGIVVMLGGDLISGNIHEELQATNEVQTMPTLLDLHEHLTSALKTLADAFGHVFVPCVSGNHGRDTRKPWAKLRFATSFDWLLYQFVARTLRSDERIVFHVPEGSDALFRVYSTRYALSHGDQFRAGDSIIGPIGPLCVTPETPILKADLSYVPAGQLKIGDTLVGFDEHVQDGARRKFRKAIVTDIASRTLECVEIETDNGARVVASLDHPWLVRSGASHAWRLTKNLSLGDRILSIGRKNENLTAWEAGYLAGVLDGEGCIDKKGRVQFTQQRNACLEVAQRLLEKASLGFYEAENGASKKGYEACFRTRLSIGREESGLQQLQLIMTIRPPRIIAEQSERLWLGRSVQIASDARVTSLRYVGMRQCAAFTTSTSTFIADGLLTHNTRGNQKKTARNQAINMEYDVLCVGHWHTYMHLPRLIVNGSLKGYDEYAYQQNYGFEPPTQALWITHPRYGITYRMPVYCEAPKRRAPSKWAEAMPA